MSTQNEKPIIFNSEMVRAILDGRKTQTRRIIKPQPGDWVEKITFDKERNMCIFHCHDEDGELELSCWSESSYINPYMLWDRLWVMETWIEKIQNIGVENEDFKSHCEQFGKYFYKADDCQILYVDKWMSSVYMPRKASRITLEITDIKVEQIQEISDKDVNLEGFISPWWGKENKLKTEFISFWKSIHGPNAWDRNDWVWVVSFKKI